MIFLVKRFSLHIRKPKKIVGNLFLNISKVRKIVRKSSRRGLFGQTELYFELEKRPAGAFLADKLVFLARKPSRRGLLGKIFDQLRIQGRMQAFEKKVREGFELER